VSSHFIHILTPSVLQRYNFSLNAEFFLQRIFGDIHKQRIVTSFVTIEIVNILPVGNVIVLHTNHLG